MTPSNAATVKLYRLLALALAMPLAVFTVGCGLQKTETGSAPGVAKRLTKIRFQTDWFPQPEHGGYYQALAKGYYVAEGLDVEIVPGGSNAQVMAMVATGRAQLGMGNGNDVIVAIARGVPIKIVAAEMQRDPQGILYHEENPVQSLLDLNGKTVIAGARSSWIPYVRKHYAIDFNIRPFLGNLGQFLSNPKFFQQCFVTNEPYFARQHSSKVGALLIAEPGFEPYRVVFTSNKYLVEHPNIVHSFVRAMVQGWIEYLRGDPTAGNEAILKLRNDLRVDFFAYSIKAMNDYQLVIGDPKRGEQMGQITSERLNREIATLLEIGVLDKPVKAEDVATFQFMNDLPERFPIDWGR